MKWNIAVYLEGGEGGGGAAIMTPTPEISQNEVTATMDFNL